jgi:hypothetical protein
VQLGLGRDLARSTNGAWSPGAGVLVGALEGGDEALGVGVDGARDEARAAAEREGGGMSGLSTEPIGVEGERLPSSEVGEYWPLVSP